VKSSAVNCSNTCDQDCSLRAFSKIDNFFATIKKIKILENNAIIQDRAMGTLNV